MPKQIAPLTELQIRKAKPAEKTYRLADGKGLYLEVMPNGSRYWRMKHRFDDKEIRIQIDQAEKANNPKPPQRVKKRAAKKTDSDGENRDSEIINHRISPALPIKHQRRRQDDS